MPVEYSPVITITPSTPKPTVATNSDQDVERSVLSLIHSECSNRAWVPCRYGRAASWWRCSCYGPFFGGRAELDGVVGQLHERLLERSLLRCQLEQRDAVVRSDLTDPVAIQSADEQCASSALVTVTFGQQRPRLLQRGLMLGVRVFSENARPSTRRRPRLGGGTSHVVTAPRRCRATSHDAGRGLGIAEGQLFERHPPPVRVYAAAGGRYAIFPGPQARGDHVVAVSCHLKHGGRRQHAGRDQGWNSISGNCGDGPSSRCSSW
jgi:hypothetical protein